MAFEKRLVRRPDEGMIAGVAAGVAATYNIDVTLVRLAFVAVAIVSAGVAVVAYLIAAIVMPREDDAGGAASLKSGVNDLVERGKSLYGETKKVIDRVPLDGKAKPITADGSTEAPEAMPAQSIPVTPATGASAAATPPVATPVVTPAPTAPGATPPAAASAASPPPPAASPPPPPAASTGAGAVPPETRRMTGTSEPSTPAPSGSPTAGSSPATGASSSAPSPAENRPAGGA